MSGDDYQEVMATIPLGDGVIGMVVPSTEGFGVIETADELRKVVTVPQDDVQLIRKGASRDIQKSLYNELLQRTYRFLGLE